MSSFEVKCEHGASAWDCEVCVRRVDLRLRQCLGMAADEAPKPLDGTPGAVQGRVDGVIQDALEGRLTPSQKSGIRTSIDRSDRVSPKSDAAVGKAIGG